MNGSEMAVWLIWLILLLLYFLPTYVASVREHQSRNAIMLLNLFLGWTFLGWVFALIWSATEVRVEKGSPENVATAADSRKCPHCAELIKAEAKVCRYCGRDVGAIGAAPAQLGGRSDAGPSGEQY